MVKVSSVYGLGGLLPDRMKDLTEEMKILVFFDLKNVHDLSLQTSSSRSTPEKSCRFGRVPVNATCNLTGALGTNGESIVPLTLTNRRSLSYTTDDLMPMGFQTSDMGSDGIGSSPGVQASLGSRRTSDEPGIRKPDLTR